MTGPLTFIQGMKELVEAASRKASPLGSPVVVGALDLVDSEGQIMLPELWGDMIRPGMTITMHSQPLVADIRSARPPAPKETDQTSSALPEGEWQGLLSTVTRFPKPNKSQLAKVMDQLKRTHLR